jgi:hypothetical protein
LRADNQQAQLHAANALNSHGGSGGMPGAHAQGQLLQTLQHLPRGQLAADSAHANKLQQLAAGTLLRPVRPRECCTRDGAISRLIILLRCCTAIVGALTHVRASTHAQRGTDGQLGVLTQQALQQGPGSSSCGRLSTTPS